MPARLPTAPPPPRHIYTYRCAPALWKKFRRALASNPHSANTLFTLAIERFLASRGKGFELDREDEAERGSEQ